MPISDLIAALTHAINTTSLGPAIGSVGGVWGLVKVTAPILSEIIRSYRERKDARRQLSETPPDVNTPFVASDSTGKKYKGVTYKDAFEECSQAAVVNMRTWDEERSRLTAEITYLKTLLRQKGVDFEG